MALLFPTAPALGEKFPVDPGTSGVSQYQWDGVKWVTVPTSVSLGPANQGVFNSYKWPALDGTVGQQLTTDGSGNLVWDVTASPTLQMLSLLEPFDGIERDFTLVLPGTTTPVSPDPSTNIIVFLGGVVQQPVASYTVFTNTITFTVAPVAGLTFYALTSIVL